MAPRSALVRPTLRVAPILRWSRHLASRRVRRDTARLALAVVLVLPVGVASAVEIADRAARPEHGMARAAPLGALLERVQEDFGGRVLKIELDTEKVGGMQRWIYEAKILKSNGHVIEAEYDAETLELLDFEGEREARERENEDD